MTTTIKRKCSACRKMTEKWQRVNGGAYHCYDGCYSTTGFDCRFPDGKPRGLQEEKRPS